MISAICVAVRAGASRFKRTARSRISVAVSGARTRGAGTSASNPPLR